MLQRAQGYEIRLSAFLSSLGCGTHHAKEDFQVNFSAPSSMKWKLFQFQSLTHRLSVRLKARKMIGRDKACASTPSASLCLFIMHSSAIKQFSPRPPLPSFTYATEVVQWNLIFIYHQFYAMRFLSNKKSIQELSRQGNRNMKHLRRDVSSCSSTFAQRNWKKKQAKRDEHMKDERRGKQNMQNLMEEQKKVSQFMSKKKFYSCAPLHVFQWRLIFWIACKWNDAMPCESGANKFDALLRLLSINLNTSLMLIEAFTAGGPQ